MAAIRHNLQRDLFKPNEERLYAVVSVTKVGKKKKASFLCAAVTTVKPETVSVYQVKKTDKDTYKKKASWRLRDLKIVDGKDGTKENSELDLYFEKNYKWTASSISDKTAFVVALWKLCERCLSQRKPTFVNVNMAAIEESLHHGDSSRTQQHTDEAAEDDYQELSAREENDLEYMMAQTNNAIGNIEAFTEQLSRDLSVLDGANIHSIMASEDQVNCLMELLEESLKEIERLDSRLTQYDDLLKTVRDQMEQMEDKDRHMVTESTNRKKLLEEVEQLANTLDLPERHITALQEGDLCKGLGLTECTNAAKAIQVALQTELSPGLNEMKAVREKREMFQKLSRDFAHRLKQHLLSIFEQYGTEQETLVKHSSELCIPQHLACHKELTPFTDLMKWLKEVDPSVFIDLCQAYTHCLSKVYDREIKDFFEAAKQKLGVALKGPKALATFKMTGSSPQINRDDPLRMSPKPSPRIGGRLARHKIKRKDSDAGSEGPMIRSGSISSVDSIDQAVDMRGRFDRVFDILLSELEPVCSKEQIFVQHFFDLESEEELTDSTSTGSDTSDGAFMSRLRTSDDFTKANNKKRDEVKKIMAGLFAVLDSEMHSFIHFGDKLDSFNTMYMLVRIGQYVITNQLSGAPVSYLSQQLGNCLISVKRLFDKFIANLRRQVEEMKIQKNKKCGILPFVSKFAFNINLVERFETWRDGKGLLIRHQPKSTPLLKYPIDCLCTVQEFAETSESIFKRAERRTDLDKAYHQLVRVVFDNIERAAIEQTKTPQAVVVLENYHHMFRVLTRLKIPSLENEKREAKQKYNSSQKAYVTFMLGRPMEKLNDFFEGVEERLAAGVKADEVGYQLAFSKQELRKCIKEYPAKEVKKGLEHLYKKFDKQLCEEENLLQVVWRSMQEEFINAYKHVEDLIHRCYPGSMIALEFTINDILDFFSDIAQSH